MDLYHLKHSELAKHLHKYKRRVVLLGHTTSRTTMDTISRFLGMAGEANDAVSAHRCICLKLPDDCDCWRTKNIGIRLMNERFFPSETSTVTHWQDCRGKVSSKKYSSNTFGRRYRRGERLCPPTNHNFPLSACVDEIKTVRERKCGTNVDNSANSRKHRKHLSIDHGLESRRGRACRKVRGTCVWSSWRHRWSSTQRDVNTTGQPAPVCAHSVVNFERLTTICRPDSLWPVNMLSRPVTRWNECCGKRLAGLISYINRTTHHRHFCCVGEKNQDCKLVSCQEAAFA